MEEHAYIIQDKKHFRLDASTVSIFRVSGELGTTCSREVAVSVRTPPRAPRWTGRAVLGDRREEAGRERREIERANTIMTENVLIENLGITWTSMGLYSKGEEIGKRFQWTGDKKVRDLSPKCTLRQLLASADVTLQPPKLTAIEMRYKFPS